MPQNSDQYVEQSCAAIKSAIDDEMKRQLMRNPSADRRRLLEVALRFQGQRFETVVREWEAQRDQEAADNTLSLGRFTLEVVGNELRADL